jgi:hypothetical protein
LNISFFIDTFFSSPVTTIQEKVREGERREREREREGERRERGGRKVQLSKE